MGRNSSVRVGTTEHLEGEGLRQEQGAGGCEGCGLVLRDDWGSSQVERADMQPSEVGGSRAGGRWDLPRPGTFGLGTMGGCESAEGSLECRVTLVTTPTLSRWRADWEDALQATGPGRLGVGGVWYSDSKLPRVGVCLGW